MARMKIRDCIAIPLACLLASCSSGGSAKVVDARANSDLGSVFAEAGRSADLGFTAVDTGLGRDVGFAAIEVGRNADVAASDARDIAADRLNLDTATSDAAEVADAPFTPDQSIVTLLDSAVSVDSTVAGQDSGTVASVDVSPDESMTSANSYYVSPSGSDNTGDGSAAHPWKTIAVSAARIDYSCGLPTLNIAAGSYDEKVVLHDSIVLTGAGSDKVTIKNSVATDTDYVVTADGSTPTVAGAVTITMTGVYVDGLAAKNRGIVAKQAALKLDGVNVYQPSGYGISIGTNVTGFTGPMIVPSPSRSTAETVTVPFRLLAI
jgi:hypothetical protein